MNGDEHPDDDRVVEALVAIEDGLEIWRLVRWRAHQGQWIHDWTGRPIDTVISWQERIQCACAK